ncbi:uncharacterized protein ACIQIH_016155 [Cyanocitta cristata]
MRGRTSPREGSTLRHVARCPGPGGVHPRHGPSRCRQPWARPCRGSPVPAARRVPAAVERPARGHPAAAAAGPGPGQVAALSPPGAGSRARRRGRSGSPVRAAPRTPSLLVERIAGSRLEHTRVRGCQRGHPAAPCAAPGNVAVPEREAPSPGQVERGRTPSWCEPRAAPAVRAGSSGPPAAATGAPRAPHGRGRTAGPRARVGCYPRRRGNLDPSRGARLTGLGPLRCPAVSPSRHPGATGVSAPADNGAVPGAGVGGGSRCHRPPFPPRLCRAAASRRPSPRANCPRGAGPPVGFPATFAGSGGAELERHRARSGSFARVGQHPRPPSTFLVPPGSVPPRPAGSPGRRDPGQQQPAPSGALPGPGGAEAPEGDTPGGTAECHRAAAPNKDAAAAIAEPSQ